jgi:hypothetical protein
MFDIKDELRQMRNEIKVLSVHMERYNTLLEEHIKRTTQLEGRVKPIEDHVHMVAAVTKVVAVGGAAIGSVLKLLNVI